MLNMNSYHHHHLPTSSEYYGSYDYNADVNVDINAPYVRSDMLLAMTASCAAVSCPPMVPQVSASLSST